MPEQPGFAGTTGEPLDLAAVGGHITRMPSAAPVPAPRPLVDPFGRTVDYLRLSLTDRCDFRCTYCMPEAMTFRPRDEVLTLAEIDRLASAFVARGVRKLRLTGGEPLVRRGVMELVRSLARHLGHGLDELTMTTNGSQLARFAGGLAEAGVRRINVSLDTLDPVRFSAITRWGQLAPVLEGLAAAKAAGLAIRINRVAQRGVNDDDLDDMMAWAATEGHDLVLIETMPLGRIDDDRVDRFQSLATVRRDLAKRWTLIDLPDRTGGPARYVRIAETGQRIGFITPLTENFCAGCNRVRLTVTGRLYLCLGQNDSLDFRQALRSGASDADIDEMIDRAIGRKPAAHEFAIDDAPAAITRHMSLTGG